MSSRKVVKMKYEIVDTGIIVYKNAILLELDTFHYLDRVASKSLLIL